MNSWILPSEENYNKAMKGNPGATTHYRMAALTASCIDAEDNLKQALDLIDILIYISQSRSDSILSKQRISAARQFLTRFKPKEDE